MKHFKKYSAFYIPYIIFVLVVTALVVFNDKATLHLWMASHNTEAGDIFFKYYTEVGGNVPFFFVAVLLFYRYRIALILLITQLSVGLVVQVLKRLWDEPRPVKYFAEHYPKIELHKIAGAHLYSHNSFPSGHTAAAFAFFLVLAFFTHKSWLQLLYFFLAVLVGFSRVYLSQHFVLDLLVGSIVGVGVTSAFYLYFEKKSMKWADGSLRDVFSRKMG
ncbi:phosphoesterase PA-phosphatase related protein [Paludibacter propionicigenes WB4]|uniref:Phosphoesterase PA-phosphatase related protein n=1 Tax=Paludibacter propionicigenes (strain DSM 17365 / JCM 13257 / WB4) TaxID=694427 RepID=E4T7N2_PALPW|nr:phosphatase PAP2 family protein [Paludibacter propionicigenes]ADQ80726.1 phosphoesterase PA-phosphatase related protein [Paludibacter propionicigenes WB4]